MGDFKTYPANTTSIAVSILRCFHLYDTKDFLGTIVRENGEDQVKYETFRQVFTKTNNLSNKLKNIGLKERDIIGLCGDNNPEWLIADFFCGINNYPNVGIHLSWPADKINYIMKETNLRGIFVAPEKIDDLIDAIRLSFEETSACPLRVIVIFSSSSKKCSIDEIKSKLPSSYSELLNIVHFSDIACSEEEVGDIMLNTLTKKEIEHDNVVEREEVNEDELYTIMYTSGSTGYPKGVAVSQKRWKLDASAYPFKACTPPITVMSYMSLAHGGDRGICWQTTFAGGRICFISANSPHTQIIHSASLIQPCFFLGMSHFWNRTYVDFHNILNKYFLQVIKDKSSPLILDAIKNSGLDITDSDLYNLLPENENWPKVAGILGSLTGKKEELLEEVREKWMGGRVAVPITGGAHTSDAVLTWMNEVFAPRTSAGANQDGSKVKNSYGATEFPGISSNGEINFDIDIKLVDVPEMGYLSTDLPHSRGEIVVRHRQNLFSTCYYNNPEASAKAFKDGWYYTGDIGLIDSSGELDLRKRGFLRIIDRKTNMIEMYVRGDSVWIEPAKLEDIYQSQIPQIHQILLAADRNAGHVIAIVVPSTDYLESYLPSHSIDEIFKLYSAEIKLHLLQLFQSVGDRFNLKHYEVPVDIVLEGNKWTVENGGITPVGKISRGHLSSLYKTHLDEIYAKLEIEEELSGSLTSSSSTISNLRISVQTDEKKKISFVNSINLKLIEEYTKEQEKTPSTPQNTNVEDFLDFQFVGPSKDITDTLNYHLDLCKKYVRIIREEHRIWRNEIDEIITQAHDGYIKAKDEVNQIFSSQFNQFVEFINNQITKYLSECTHLSDDEIFQFVQKLKEEFINFSQNVKIRRAKIHKLLYIEKELSSTPLTRKLNVMKEYAYNLDIVLSLAERVKVRVPYQIWAHGWWKKPRSLRIEGEDDDADEVGKLSQSLGSAEVFCEFSGEQIERDIKDVGILRYHCLDGEGVDRTFSSHQLLQSVSTLLDRFINTIVPPHSELFSSSKQLIEKLYKRIDVHKNKYWCIEKGHYWQLRTVIDKLENGDRDTPASFIFNTFSSYPNRLCLGIPNISQIISNAISSLSNSFSFYDVQSSLSHMTIPQCHIAKAANMELIPYNNYLWLTYSQIGKLAVRVAKALISIGLEEGSFVGICGYNTIEWMVCDFACSLAGMASVGVHTTNNNRMSSYIISNCQISALISVRDHFLTLDGGDGDTHWSIESILKDSPSIKKIISMDMQVADLAKYVSIKRSAEIECVFPSVSIHSLLDFVQDDSIEKIELKDPKTLFTSPNDIVSLFYTSGTSGVPKGVIVTAQNFYNDISERTWMEPLITVSYIPLSHSSDRLKIWEFMGNGGRIGYAYFAASNWLSHERDKKSSSLDAVSHSHQNSDPTSYIKSLFLQVQYVKPTAMSCPPNIWNSLYHYYVNLVTNEYNYYHPNQHLLTLNPDNEHLIPENIKESAYSFIRSLFGGSIKVVITGGAPTPPPLYKFMQTLFPSITLADSYGATECGGILENGFPLVSKNVEVQLAPLPFSSSPLLGEIIVKSPNSSPGYFKEERKTKEVFKEEWYHTGDVGKIIKQSGNNTWYKVCGRVFSAVPLGDDKVIFPGNLEAVYESSNVLLQIFLNVNKEKKLVGIVLPNEHFRAESEEFFVNELKKIAKEFDLCDYEIPSVVVVEREIVWEQNNGFLSPQFKKSLQKFINYYQSYLQ